VPVQLNGRTCEMDAIEVIAGAHGLIVVEDAAHGLGLEYIGKDAGAFGIGGMSARSESAS